MNEVLMPSTKASFLASPIHCIKHVNYFDIYDSLLSKYVGTEFTFVEVGVLDGGSLFMWRHFFGKKARIIGIDLNPSALKWIESGFEIYIGDQTDRNFWENFYKRVGPVDVLLDDGGHMNDQQTVTVLASLPNINDGGILMVEDTCTSFMKFDSFKENSFISHMKREIDSLHSRSPGLDFLDTGFSDNVHSITFFENICVINVDRPKCSKNDRIVNGGTKTESKDFRYEAETKFIGFMRKLYDGVSIDYLSQAQVTKHPTFARLVNIGIVRKVIRLFVIPLRALFYFCIKCANASRFKKLTRQFLN
jgi:hypothetical protein